MLNLRLAVASLCTLGVLAWGAAPAAASAPRIKPCQPGQGPAVDQQLIETPVTPVVSLGCGRLASSGAFSLVAFRSGTSVQDSLLCVVTQFKQYVNADCRQTAPARMTVGASRDSRNWEISGFAPHAAASVRARFKSHGRTRQRSGAVVQVQAAATLAPLQFVPFAFYVADAPRSAKNVRLTVKDWAGKTLDGIGCRCSFRSFEPS